MQGQVQEFGASKAGKPKIKVSGNWYFCKTDRDTGEPMFDKPVLNQMIDMVTGSFVMGESTFLTLESWKPANVIHPTGPVRTQSAPRAQAPQRPAQGAATPSPYIEEATLRYISNVLGNLCAAKTITQPGQLLAWFNAAKLAHEGKSSGTPFSDALPGREPGSDDNYEPSRTADGDRT
jgi:hypothetical protein